MKMLRRTVVALTLVGCASLVGVGDLKVADECSSPGPDSGLVAYFPFDEGVGLCAKNCSSSTSACFVNNTPSWTDGWRNGGVAVDNDGGGCMSMLGLNFDGTTFTFSGFIQPSRATNNNVGIIIGRHPTNAPTGWRLVTTQDDAGTDGVSFQIYNGDAGAFDLFTPAPQPLHAWWHVVLTYVPDTKAQLDVDDASAEAGSPPAIAVDAGPLRIGCRSDSNLTDYNLVGTIDEVRVYDRELTQAERQALEQK